MLCCAVHAVLPSSAGCFAVISASATTNYLEYSYAICVLRRNTASPVASCARGTASCLLLDTHDSCARFVSPPALLQECPAGNSCACSFSFFGLFCLRHDCCPAEDGVACEDGTHCCPGVQLAGRQLLLSVQKCKHVFCTLVEDSVA